MTLPTITIIGNLTSAPTLRETKTGRHVCNFTIASNSSRKNDQTGEWEQTAVLYVNCTAWDDAHSLFATNIANSLAKSMRVIARGKLRQRDYTDKNGMQRTAIEMNVNEIGIAIAKNHTTTTPTAAPVAQDPWGASDGEPEF